NGIRAWREHERRARRLRPNAAGPDGREITNRVGPPSGRRPPVKGRPLVVREHGPEVSGLHSSMMVQTSVQLQGRMHVHKPGANATVGHDSGNSAAKGISSAGLGDLTAAK